MSAFVGGIGGIPDGRSGGVRVCSRSNGRPMLVRMSEDGGHGRTGRRILAGLVGGAVALLGGSVGTKEALRFPPVESALAGTLYKNKTIVGKLAQVPVFLITSAGGQPYLATLEESRQVGLIFFSIEDATKMMEQMKMNAGAEEARIFPLTLDKAMEMVKAKPTPSGLKSQGGQDLMMVFRLYPDTAQVKNAGSVLGRRQGASNTIPLFVVRGLVVRKGREEVQPMFFTKEDLDSNWNRLRSENPKLPRRPNIEVYSLQDIVEKMENGDEALRGWGFYPPSRSVSFMEEQQEKKSGKTRMHINPLLSD
ncbi:hypothetical protein NDN08_004652 [Rhodosorus marinus]|uniref:Uncharacterized protein n=1 Tax=Rhodosorus marinus TaxID=101924 RepID=A0AAV8UR13_9RHOD|nr:hypothetical protein NDN08_004652 [Rhodosorus marinus]